MSDDEEMNDFYERCRKVDEAIAKVNNDPTDENIKEYIDLDDSTMEWACDLYGSRDYITNNSFTQEALNRIQKYKTSMQRV